MSGLTASEIVLRPVISEKSMDHTQRGKYTFAVHDEANKLQIKAAVEELRQGHRARRQRPHDEGQGEVRGTRRGRTVGSTSPWKKAIVTVPGHTIQFFEGVCRCRCEATSRPPRAAG